MGSCLWLFSLRKVETRPQVSQAAYPGPQAAALDRYSVPRYMRPLRLGSKALAAKTKEIESVDQMATSPQ